MERFNIKKLNEGGVKEQHQVTIRNKCAALENLEESADINRTWTILDRTSKLQTKRVKVIVNQSIINHGLLRNVQNWLIEGSRLNYSSCRTQVKRMKIT
jgi:hypothetical protein